MGIFSRLIQRIKRRKTASIPIEPPNVPIDSVSLIDDPKWEVFSCIEPGETAAKEVLNASYSNEIGTTLSIYCMVVFENKTQYKLVAPWLGTGRVIEKANLTDFQVIRVPRDPVKDFLK